MPKVRKRWSDEDMTVAVRRVQEGETAYKVSKDLGIPIATLYAKCSGRLAMNAKLGGRTILTPAEEDIIVQWMLTLSSKGFPVTKSTLVSNVSALMRALNRPNPFTNGIPGRKWFTGFLRRHPEISERLVQSLSKGLTEITEEDVRTWFASVQTELGKENLTNIDGERKFSCDKSSFFLCPPNEPVYVKKGDRTVRRNVQNDVKENLTVLFMTDAQGKLGPPLIMFPNKRISYGIQKSVPKDWAIEKSANGCMTAGDFYHYIKKVFDPWLIKENVKKPVVLFLDGDKLHMTAPLLKFCATNGIKLVELCPNATHILQPENVSLFQNLQRSWSTKVAEWRDKNDNQRIRKEDFAPLLKEAMSQLDWEKIMRNGFRKTGLHPLNPDAIDYQHLLTAKGHLNVENESRGQKKVFSTADIERMDIVIVPEECGQNSPPAAENSASK